MDNQTPAQTVNIDKSPDNLPKVGITSFANQPIDKKNKSNMRKIIMVAVIGLVLALGIAAFLLNREPPDPFKDIKMAQESSPTAETTLSWTTYTNAKNNFSIEYPSDWVKTESPSQDGVGFKPQNSLDAQGITDDITVYVGQKTLTEEELTFDQYVKVAATLEIQNYNGLASIAPVTLTDGTRGYKTTWMVQSIMNDGSEESESAPITYYEIPGNSNELLRVSSGSDTDQAIYDRMINSVLITTPVESLDTGISPEPTVTPAIVPNEEAELEVTIKEQILADSEGDGSSLTVSVSEISGDYAEGMASDDGGGGLWFAAKVNGSWELVWDGNGIILCSDLTEYPDFPTSMISECYDQATDEMVKR